MYIVLTFLSSRYSQKQYLRPEEAAEDKLVRTCSVFKSVGVSIFPLVDVVFLPVELYSFHHLPIPVSFVINVLCPPSLHSTKISVKFY